MKKTTHARTPKGPAANTALTEYFWDLPRQLGARGAQPAESSPAKYPSPDAGARLRGFTSSSPGEGGYSATQMRAVARWRRIDAAIRSLPERQQQILIVAYTTTMHPLRDGLLHFDTPEGEDVDDNERDRGAEYAIRIEALNKALRERARHELGGDAELRRLTRREEDQAKDRARQADPDPRILRNKARKKFEGQIDRLVAKWRREQIAQVAVRRNDEAIETERLLWHDLEPVLRRRVEAVREVKQIFVGDIGDAGEQILELSGLIRAYLSEASKQSAAITCKLVTAAHKAFEAAYEKEQTKVQKPKSRAERFADRLAEVA